ncbi:hypothetical protein PV724_47425 [Streptomyces europaeiscabiei]|uniref:hypothetical protein n=1 Tax=Streptomyces europaeiscabiei TaxID=146819 RepID=UPI0029BF4C14|nr:hypothetical protein [Streptomyces europaeiscabiei]MDX3550096.1 hypothetical protein [Streptomyces europaeiscabiei]
MTQRSPKANAVLVQALGSGIRSTGNGLADLPALLRRVMEEEAWRSFVTPMGKLVEYDRFVDFVTTPPSQGLGATVDLMRKIVADDPVASDLLDQALQNPNGGDRRSADFSLDNIQTEPPSGTSREAGLRRLRKDRPDLHAEVLAGALSTHAAMVLAGFRKRKISIPVTNAEDAAKALRRNLEPAQIKDLVRLLTVED